MTRILAAFSLALFISAPVAAESAQDPLRFIPDKTDLIVKVERPRELIEGITKLDAVKQAGRLDVVRQFLDSAQSRRVLEFIAYYERDFGAKWPELLDKLAGGGIALGAKIAPGDNNPILLAIQGTDEALVKKLVERASSILEQELALGDSKDKVAKEKYKDFDVLRLGKDFCACRIESALLVSNKPETLHTGIDQHISNTTKGGATQKNILAVEGLAKAKKLLPPNPQLWLWYGFDYIKSLPETKDLFVTPRNNTVLTFLFAGYLDIARRSDFMAAGLYRHDDGYSLTIRMPAGRDGMAEDVELHLPRDAARNGTLPLLEPKNVIASHSFYLDLGAFWEKRDKMMSPANAKDFEKGVKEASRFLPGTSIDKLFTQSGPYHRLVAVHRDKSLYKVEPQLKLPDFGYVVAMRDPAFGKSVEVLVRGGAALASTQVSLKLFEEKYGDVAILGYRFPEDGKFPADEQNLRFNFVPCYAVVQDQAIAASSVELCKELIDIVKKEDRSKLITQNMHFRGHATGALTALSASPEQLLTQTILNQAVSEAEAKKQVEQLLKYLEKLGTLDVETDYTAKNFRFDVRWRFGK
jgi:hypothetical protein